MRTGGPRQDSLDLTQYGLHYGVVCQNKDPENLDRIKVRLPWLDHCVIYTISLLLPLSVLEFARSARH